MLKAVPLRAHAVPVARAAKAGCLPLLSNFRLPGWSKERAAPWFHPAVRFFVYHIGLEKGQNRKKKNKILKTRNIAFTTSLPLLSCFAVSLSAPALRYFCSIHLAVLAILLCLLASGGCGNRPGLSRLRPCRLPGIDDEVLCGKFRVFENRQTRTGRTIDLNVVVLPSLDPKNKTEPLFDLAGGPGVA